MIELNKIYNEDCLEGMKRIPDGSVDLIVCDLPYGTTRNQWDSIIPLDKLWEQYKRVTKPNSAIVLFSQMPFTAVLATSNLSMLRYEWIWQKETATGFLNAKKMPLKAHENILVFYKELPTYNPQMRGGFEPYTRTRRGGYSDNYGIFKKVTTTSSGGQRYPISCLRINRDRGKDRFHPTQKPVDLIRYFIRTYTDRGGACSRQLHGEWYYGRRVHQGEAGLHRL